MKITRKKQEQREQVRQQVQAIVERENLASHRSEQLLALLADQEPGVRWAAQSVLEARGTEALEAIVTGLQHTEKKVRGICALLLDHLADDRCIEPLIQAMRHDPQESVRRCAMHALSCDGCKACPLNADIVAALIEVALTDRSKQVRRRAVFYLEGRHKDPRVVPAIQTLLDKEADSVVQHRAHRLLERSILDVS